MSIWAENATDVAAANAGPAAFALGPASSFGENVGAGFRAIRAADTTNALERQRAAAYAPIVDALNAGLPWAERWVNPWAGQAILPEGGKVRRRNSFFSPAVTLQEQEATLWAEIARRRETDPNFLPGLPKTREEFEAAILQAANDTLAAAEDINSRATALGHVGYFLGAIGGAFTDPVNIISLPIGAGRALGQGIARVMAKEALINMGVEAASQPAIAENYAALERDFTAGNAAFNIATAGAGAALIRGGIEIAPKAYDWTREGTAALVDKLRAKPNRTPDENAALHVLEAELEVRQSNPFTNDSRGTATHDARLAEAMDDLQAGRPVDLPDVDESLLPEPLRRESIARDMADREAREAAEREAFLAENPMPKRRPPSLIDELRAELKRRGKSLNLQAAIDAGAVHPDDLKSDVSLKMLFRKNGGIHLDQLEDWFRQRGFDPDNAPNIEPETYSDLLDTQVIADAIQRDIAGRKTAQGVYSRDGEVEAQAYRDWLAADEAWQRRYDPPEMEPPPRIEDLTDEEYLALEREAIQAEEFAVRGAEGLYDDIPFDETGDIYPAPGAGRAAEIPLQSGTEPQIGRGDAGGPGGQRGPQEGRPAADGPRGLGGARDSAAAQEWLDSFADPAGSGQKIQTDRLDHDIRAAMEAADELLALDPDFAVRLADDGEPVRLADLLDELDKDQAFLADVEGCL
jgi:hypothetical protein